MTPLSEVLRLVMAVAAAIAVVLIVVIFHPYRHTMRLGIKLAAMGVGVILAAIVYGVIEAHYMRVPIAARQWATLVGIGWLDIGLAWAIHERHATRRAQQPPTSGTLDGNTATVERHPDVRPASARRRP